MSDVTIRRADGRDATDALRVVEGALLEVDSEAVRERAVAGDVLVADIDGTVVGALVLDTSEDGEDSHAGQRVADSDSDDTAHIEAVAVTPQRRGQGIGRALIDAAAAEHAALTADFRADVREFWEACGFEVCETDDSGRVRGRRE